MSGKILLKNTLLCIAAGLWFTACSKKDDGSSESEEKQLLTAYADYYILPAYTAVTLHLQILKTAADEFTAVPDVSRLSMLSQAWREAYLFWQQVDMLEFGPAADVSLRNAVNTYPSDVAKIESLISTGTYDLEATDNKDACGFPALDYLLHGAAATPEHTVAGFVSSPTAAFRKKYLLDVIIRLQRDMAKVLDAWHIHDYRGVFIEKGGRDAGSSLSMVVNAYVLYYERYFVSGKIGKPLGATTGIPLPNYTEAYYSPRFSKELAVTALQAIIRLYEGTGYDGTRVDTSMRGYLIATGVADENGVLLADDIIGQLDTALLTLQALTPTIREGVLDNRPEILQVYESLAKVIDLFKVHMAAALGITIIYPPDDGE